jgi:OOP family OmpA-OmpF porin
MDETTAEGGDRRTITCNIRERKQKIIYVKEEKEMKKIIIMVMSIAVALAMALPASAIELSPDAANIPSIYASVKDGQVVYRDSSTAYSPGTLNAILTAYGLELTPEAAANVPASYAQVVDGNVVFGSTSAAFTPEDYNNIFTAYGLELSPEDAAAIQGPVNYCKVVDGEIVFGKTSTAYSAMGLSQILAAYKLPMVEEVVVVEEVECVDADGDGICDDVDACANTPKGAKIDERGCWVLEQNCLFDFDKAVVKSEFFPLLDEIVQIMKDNPSLRIELEGHTDSIGTNRYNQGLSERRANAVKQYLVEKGMVDMGRVSAIGYGEEKPIATNETAEGRQLNRRVELKPIW